MSLGFGCALTAKKVSAICWSAAEAAQKHKTCDESGGVVGSEQAKSFSYQPRLLLQPMSAHPANHPCPRRLQSRMGIAELSRAW
jgi:hypothetical protein